MTDEHLSEFGQERVRELADGSDPWSRRTVDRLRYAVLLLVQLVQMTSALGFLASVGLLGITQSAGALRPLAINSVTFIVAYAANILLQRDWWYTDG